MKEIRQLTPEAHASLMEQNPATWYKAFLQTGRECASFKNGILESFNGHILAARGKPIITMIEDIKIYIMQRNLSISQFASKLDDHLTPSIRKHIKKMKME